MGATTRWSVPVGKVVYTGGAALHTVEHDGSTMTIKTTAEDDLEIAIPGDAGTIKEVCDYINDNAPAGWAALDYSLKDWGFGGQSSEEIAEISVTAVGNALNPTYFWSVGLLERDAKFRRESLRGTFEDASVLDTPVVGTLEGLYAFWRSPNFVLVSNNTGVDIWVDPFMKPDRLPSEGDAEFRIPHGRTVEVSDPRGRRRINYLSMFVEAGGTVANNIVAKGMTVDSGSVE